MKAAFIAAICLVALTGCTTARVIKGRYVDSSGRGVAGAPVTLWRESYFHKAELVGKVVTDVDGRFEAAPPKRATFVMVDNHFVRVSAFQSKDLVVERGSPR